MSINRWMDKEAVEHIYNGILLLLLLSRFSHVRLCKPIDSSPPGSAILGILQARALEWVAIAFSSAWKWKVKVKSFSRVWLLATPWTSAYQAPPSMGFSRQEYWSGVPLPSLNNNSSLIQNKYTKISMPSQILTKILRRQALISLFCQRLREIKQFAEQYLSAKGLCWSSRQI